MRAFRHPPYHLQRAVRLRPHRPLPFRTMRVGRLTAMPGRLGAMPQRVKAAPKVAESFYHSAEWLAYRKAHRAWTIAQQGGVWCCKCGSTHRLILDHDVERKDGGADFPPFEEANWYCAGDHNRKTAEARARRASGEGGDRQGGGRKFRGPMPS